MWSGGGSGIRTHDEIAPIPVFKTSAINHSAIPPQRDEVPFYPAPGQGGNHKEQPSLRPFLSLSTFGDCQGLCGAEVALTGDSCDGAEHAPATYVTPDSLAGPSKGSRRRTVGVGVLCSQLLEFAHWSGGTEYRDFKASCLRNSTRNLSGPSTASTCTWASRQGCHGLSTYWSSGRHST